MGGPRAMGVEIQRCKNHLVVRVVPLFTQLKPSSCVSVFPSTLARLAVKLETPAGSSIAWNMASSLMVTCHLTRLLGTTASKHSSQKLVLESMFLELFLLTWSQL